MVMNKILSDRLKGFESTIFDQMSTLAQKTGAINLGQGFPNFDGPSEVMNAAIEAIKSGQNQYSPGIGIEPLRHAVAQHQKRFYDLSINPDTEVLITAGATEGIAASLLSLCNIGDEVVAFEPFYDSYSACISMAGGVKKAVTLRYPDYSYDPDQLEKACASPRAKLIILNTPHNPTGKVFSKAELEHIAELAIKYDLLVIADEVYEHLVMDGQHTPIATLPKMFDRTISISSGGKTFSFTGWKIGWVTSTPELINAVKMSKQFLTYTNGTPFQHAIAIGLNLKDDYYRQLKNDFTKKRDILCEGLEKIGFEIRKPAGTYFATTDISKIKSSNAQNLDGIEFCLQLPEKCGVVAIPCSVFYDDTAKTAETENTEAEGKYIVRFAFCKDDETLSKAIICLGKLK